MPNYWFDAFEPIPIVPPDRFLAMFDTVGAGR
jgi:hypothetical protein